MPRYKQLLLIDDDEVFVFVMQKILRKCSNFTKVVHISNGLDAIKYLDRLDQKKQPLPELIFLDLNMPVLDGWQFLETIDALPYKSELQVYVISSSIDPTEKIRAERYTCVKRFVPKPVSLDWLKRL